MADLAGKKSKPFLESAPPLLTVAATVIVIGTVTDSNRDKMN